MTRTLSMNVATSRIATGKGATVKRNGNGSNAQPARAERQPLAPTPAAPAPAPAPAPVKESKPAPAEGQRVLAHACVSQRCGHRNALVEWGPYGVKSGRRYCRGCGAQMAVAIVYLPDIEAQTRPAPSAPLAQEAGEVVGSHAPGSRSARLLAALERKMKGMIERGEKFTDEQVERSADLREAANAWLLVTDNQRQFVVDLKRRAEGQRSAPQLRGALNFWRAELARKMGVRFDA